MMVDEHAGDIRELYRIAEDHGWKILEITPRTDEALEKVMRSCLVLKNGDHGICLPEREHGRVMNIKIIKKELYGMDDWQKEQMKQIREVIDASAFKVWNILSEMIGDD